MSEIRPFAYHQDCTSLIPWKASLTRLGLAWLSEAVVVVVVLVVMFTEKRRRRQLT